jgi:hypothetical protein
VFSVFCAAASSPNSLALPKNVTNVGLEIPPVVVKTRPASSPTITALFVPRSNPTVEIDMVRESEGK